ncbi:MAG: hypothetical protein SNJ67_13365 [Chloracidobacterium sp.]|uniref:Deoxyhypusine synthase n=1 Tax=Chloracidobacterium validum TaxID=2821543 RepID=A0ABX8BAJ2_9BACT|nr:hypothetical protein [Chloracidobacterium validum]QUW02740.1 hypothetical protein J8C06_10425 [Chloracidobacterium validum]
MSTSSSKSHYAVSPLDFAGLSTYPLAARPSKVSARDLSRPCPPGATLRDFFASLPNILAVKELRAAAAAVRAARARGRAVIAGFGGHVIKCGLGPLLIDLMAQGYLTAFACNGSSAIHDFEIALVGATSEDVDATLGSGAFGGAEETGTGFNAACAAAAADGIGLGEGLGRWLDAAQPPYAEQSVLIQAYRRRAPVTVHVAIGTDITHIHPTAVGAHLGAATHHDFRLLCGLVRELHDGGVYLNFGSAVILPEVFLKAVTTVRNLGYPLTTFTTVNFDFIQHYRPLTNVVRRPVAGGAGRGIALTGHHELLLPLFAAAIQELDDAPEPSAASASG